MWNGGKDRPIDKHLITFVNLQLTVCQPSLVYRRNLIVAISDKVWDRLEDPDSEKWLCEWVPLRTIVDTPGSPFFKVKGLLAEVQADWEN